MRNKSMFYAGLLLLISGLLILAAPNSKETTDESSTIYVAEATGETQSKFIDDLEFIVVHEESFRVSNRIQIGYFKGTKVMYIKSARGDMELLVKPDGSPVIYGIDIVE